MSKSTALLTELIEPTIGGLGLQLWGVEHVTQGRYSLLRIYIEREDGITIEDCEAASRQLSALLDVEDPIAGEYTLEVSSPGIDRPLFTAQQFAMYTGTEVRLRTRVAVANRRKFNGRIASVRDNTIVLEMGDEQLELQHDNIEKANIVYRE